MGRTISSATRRVKKAAKNPVKAYTTAVGASLGGFKGGDIGASLGGKLTNEQAQQIPAGGAGGGGGVSAFGRAGPSYMGLRDPVTGGLRKEFSFDPYAGEAAQKLKEQAFSTGTSPWAQMQLSKQAFEESGAKDLAARQGAQALAQSQSELARFGGLGGGARTSLARQGARDILMAKQNVARQGLQSRLGIGAEDITRKENLLKSFGDLESRAQESNIGALRGDVGSQREFDLDKYRQQMALYGAGKTADAQTALAHQSNRGKK